MYLLNGVDVIGKLEAVRRAKHGESVLAIDGCRVKRMTATGNLVALDGGERMGWGRS